jgi:hypothetical protein
MGNLPAGLGGWLELELAFAWKFELENYLYFIVYTLNMILDAVSSDLIFNS